LHFAAKPAKLEDVLEGGFAMWLFRMSSFVYFILAALGVVGSVFAYNDIKNTEAEKAAARSHKAPEAVPIEAYTPAKTKSDFDEVNLLVQLDVEKMVEIVKTKRGVERGRTIVGRLYPVAAKDRSQPAPGVLVTKDGLSDAQIMAMVVSPGAFGPIIRLNGRNDDGLSYDASEATKSGDPVAENAVYVEPFAKGRDAALVAKDDAAGVGGVFLVISALVGAYGWWRRRREQKQKAIEDEMASYT
jgi:hypothetical protein